MSPRADVETWQTSGVFEIRALISAQEVQYLLDTFERLRTAGAPTSQQMLYTHEVPLAERPPFGVLMEQWLNPHMRPDGAACAAIASRVRHALSERFEEELFLFQDVLMSKRHGHRPFPWHQDEPYWPVTTPGGVVVWCALDRVDRSNGAVEVAVGSHKSGLGPAIDLHTGEPQLGATEAVPDLLEYEHRCADLAPGDALLFHPRIWHRSGPNVTGAARRAWSSSWLPEAARWCVARAPRHPLASRLEDGGPVCHTLAWRTRQ